MCLGSKEMLPQVEKVGSFLAAWWFKKKKHDKRKYWTESGQRKTVFLCVSFPRKFRCCLSLALRAPSSPKIKRQMKTAA